MLILVGAAASTAAAPARIAVLPFTIHAEKDLSFLNNGIRAMLVARLIHEGATSVGFHTRAAESEAEALALGKKLNADYVLMGALTLFGNSVSTDAVFLEVGTGRALVRFSQFGDDSGDVIQHVDLLARQINQDVFGIAPPPVARTGPAAAYPSPAQVGTRPAVSAEPQVWRSNRLRMAARSLSAGDVDGDGRPELVVSDASALWVYRRDGEGLYQLAVLRADSGERLVGVDAVDANHNDRAEIYVTAHGKEGRLASFVLEWDGGPAAPDRPRSGLVLPGNRHLRTGPPPGRAAGGNPHGHGHP